MVMGSPDAIHPPTTPPVSPMSSAVAAAAAPAAAALAAAGSTACPGCVGTEGRSRKTEEDHRYDRGKRAHPHGAPEHRPRRPRLLADGRACFAHQLSTSARKSCISSMSGAGDVPLLVTGDQAAGHSAQR